MYWDFSEMSLIFANRKNSRLLLDGLWGIEREAQRITPDGDLALTPHPAAFGDKISNPCITTDFAESQLELVTPPFPSVEQAYWSLHTIQTGVEKELAKGNELLWPFSMPPRLPDEDTIPIARFDDTEDGQEREIYRRGLALRYGKKMQMISGIHYNFSLGKQMQEFLYQTFGEGKERRSFFDEVHFALARNFLRYRWLLIYLFGASPNIDETYHSVICKEIETIRKDFPDCYDAIVNFERYATSLRVSRYGYSSLLEQKQTGTYNSLQEYIRNIRELLATRSERYAQLGIYRNGMQVQLNDRVLQKENEFYSSIRLKTIQEKGQTQLEALESKGVQYVEVRILDIDPFEKTGFSIDQLRFMQVFMLLCLFEGSPYISESELQALDENHHLVAMSGRRTCLVLNVGGNKISIQDWSKEIFTKLMTIAETMGEPYVETVNKEYHKINNPQELPSARISSLMLKNQQSYLQFGIQKAIEYSQNS